MSGPRSSQNSNRQTRKPRQDASPWNKRGRTNERGRNDYDRYRSEQDLSKQDDFDKDKDKDRKKKDSNLTKSNRRAKSPRRIKEIQSNSSDRRNQSQRRDLKTKNEIKEKAREKKQADLIDRHPLFQDNSQLAQLIAQITSTQEENSRRVSASQYLRTYVYDAAHLEGVKRNCSNIFSALEDILKERGNNELKDNVIQCYASIGHVLGIDCDKFFQWIFSKIPSAANDQLRVFYLRTISEAIKLDVGKQVFYDTMPMIMASLQDVLENADSPDLLLIILDILSIIARDYPHIFTEYFRDTVDILVGWHIDTSQTKELTSKTADCLISFHVYWVSDMRFSLTLLGQFLEDMEAYAEELSSINHGEFTKEDTPSPFVSLPKLTALTKVFTTVVSGLGEFFSPGREAKITTNYITDTVNRIISCVDICGYDLKFEQVLIAANNCLTVLVGSLAHSISVSCVRIVKFVNDQLGHQQQDMTYNLHKSALQLIEKMVSVVAQGLPLDVIPEIIGPEKPLMKIRCFIDEELLALLLKIMQTLLSIKNIPLLEAVYKLFVDDIKKSYNVLVNFVENVNEDVPTGNSAEDKDGEENLEHQQVTPTYIYDSLLVEQAYKYVIFDLAALSEIVVFKSSVTGAWKVDPSSFNLLTTIIDPTHEKLANQYPAVQFSILSTLFCHSQRCNNFIPSAKVKGQPNSPESIQLLNILCNISLKHTASTDIKCLCAVWFSEIIGSIAALPMDTQKKHWNVKPVLEALVVMSYDVEPIVRIQVSNSISKITRTGLIHPVILSKVLSECLPHLTSLEKQTFDSFRKMVVAFPADLLASLPTVTRQQSKLRYIGPNQATNAQCQKDLWLLCKNHMCRAPTGNLHSYGFKIVMKTLLCGPDMNKEERWWMESQFMMCQRINKTAEPICGDMLAFPRFAPATDSVFPGNVNKLDVLLWFFFTWGAAEFCVNTRLKTPLGKALETFQTIEGALKELKIKFKEKAAQSKTPKRIKSKTKEDGIQQILEPPKYNTMHQAVLLLQFLENLEKLMYNAYEGTTTSLPPTNRIETFYELSQDTPSACLYILLPVRTFFRTNRSTCCEWLNRIQESVTILANMCGCPEKAVRNGYLWLQHLQKTGSTLGSDFERAIVTVIDSLMQLHCYESIQGVLEWSRKTIGRNFFWMHASSVKAKGSLESAAEQFKTGLHNYLSPDRLKLENVNELKKPTVTVLTKDPVINADPLSIEFLVSQVTDCYLQLCDWNELQEWNKNVAELHQKFPSVQGLKSTVDHSYVKAMMKFEEHDFAGVHEQLEQLPGATMSNILQEQFPVLGTEKESKVSSKNMKHTSDENENSNISTFSDNATPQAMLCQSRIYLMQALTLYWTSGLNTLKGSRVGSLHSTAWETVDNLLTQANNSAFAPLHALLRNQSAKSTVPFLMQLKSISAIRETLMVTESSQDANSMFINVYGRSQYINPFKTEISILNEALRTASYLQFHHSLHKKGWVGPATYSIDKLPNVQTLQVMTAKLARKQGNKKLAESLLAKQLSLLESKAAIDGKMYLTGGAQLKLKQLSASVSSGKVVDPLAAVDILKESAKLKRTLGNLSEAIDVLCSSILLSERQLGGGSNKSNNNYIKLSDVSARSFVTLAKWILTEPRMLSPIGDSEETVAISPKVREVVKAISKSGNSKFFQTASFSNIMSEGAVVCGQLLQHSTYRCTNLGKTWFSFADWCYKWGRKIVEQDSFAGQIDLLEEEKEVITSLLPKNVPAAVTEKVINILKLNYGRETMEENDLSSSVVLEEGSNEHELDRLKFHLMLATEDHLILKEEHFSTLSGIWKNVIERTFLHYKQAATAYFTYLKISGNETITSTDVSKQSEYGNITATLRLLRLLVKYSGELKQHMETPLSETPTNPWRSIIPQLFARLNHPESYVQNSVANLLGRLAKDSPQLIVYPTVVGCSDIIPQQQLSKSSAAGILRAYQYEAHDEFEQQPDISPDEIDVASQVDTEENTSQEEQQTISVEDKQMLSSLHVILDTLNIDNPLLVQEVKCVIQELRRITLLWDELWLGSLTQLHQEAQRRMHQLQAEIHRVHNNKTLNDKQKASLIKEKHAALMRPLIYALERLHKITSQVPETPHELSFQTQFADQVLKAINSLKNPVDPSKPELSWNEAKQLYTTLQARAQKRALSNLVMSEASPILSEKKFDLIPLPGQDRNHDQIVTLQSFSNDIQILPTKTKPKKLVMIGSDGQRYPYLFKGLEDLHLDERIMQFLQICNHMFSKEDKSREKKYFARHYSVTPLGPRSGLIQWVDGATPLFTLYRRWQQREAAAQAILKNQTDKNYQQVIQPPARPTELFYNKLNPLLKEKNIDFSSSRKDWPLAILKKALHDLSEETPNYLLSQELWCSSVNASDWWYVTQSYSRSVAVMSMIGYVIGLGDRHLDNILVDLTTGEVVHIDYNVCFEKGKALRVPEKVPFRMTRNMQNALGVTGVEGIFRSSCEKVMNTLRHGREILLTLLEAFVYDPLIDWTTANDAAFAGAFYGGGGGAADEGNRFSRKEMERGITQTLLSTRVAEMKVSWTANKDELVASLNKLKQCLESYCNALSNQKYANEELTMLQQQINILKAALVNPDHPLHSLQSRYDKQAKLLNNLKYWKQKIQEKLIECDQTQKQFQHAYLSLQGGHIANLYSEVCKSAEVGAPSFTPAISFLNGAGKSNVVSQCEQVESELIALLNQRRAALRACLDTILSYSSIVSQFPSDYKVHHCFVEWIPLFSYLLDEPSVSKCKQVLKDHNIVSERKASIVKDAEGLSNVLENKLSQYFNEQNSKLLKLYERRSHEQVETSSLSGPVTETWNALRKFIGDAGSAGATSLACVTVTALTTLNKRQLVMENAAAVAGERLMHLTSRDGDWFLDELCTMCGNISQLLSVLKNNPLRSAGTQKPSSTGDVMENITFSMQVVFAAVKSYNSLQEFMSNFRTIIVPEAVKRFLANDMSLLNIADKIRELIETLPINTQTLCEHYEQSFRDKTDVSDDVTNIMENIKSRLEQLSEPDGHADNEEGTSTPAQMSGGQMLLAGFSGLFTKVEVELSSLYETNRKMKVPDGFDHIDLLQEQKNLKLSKTICSTSNSKWSNYLFVKKLIVIHGFFEACLQQSYATRDIEAALKTLNASVSKDGVIANTIGEPTLHVFNEDLLCLPVKQFIAECVQNFIIGIPSQALTNLCINYVGLLASNVARDVKDGRKGVNTMEELCKKVVEYNLKSSVFPTQHLSQASLLINAHDAAWRKHDLARRLDSSIAAQKDILHRAQLQLARFQWIYEEFLTTSKKKSQQSATPTKVSVILEIKKRLQAITHVEHNIPAVMERYNQLESSIEQRLKWAGGANPALNNVVEQFHEVVNERKALLVNESKLTPEVINLATAIIKMETFKSSASDRNTFEQAAVIAVQKCEEACEAFESCMGDLGDVESFMNRLQISIPPKEAITTDWMKTRLEVIDNQVNDIYANEPSMKSIIGVERESLKAQVSSIKISFTSHHALVGEVKAMLKTLAKDEEAEECLNVRRFIQTHNVFSEDSSIVLKKILNLCGSSRSPDQADNSPTMTEDESFTTIKLIEDLSNNVVYLHDQLLTFGATSLQNETTVVTTSSGQESFASALQKNPSVTMEERQENVFPETQGDGGGKMKNEKEITQQLLLPLSPSLVNSKVAVPSPKKKPTGVPVRDPKTGKALQEKNVYALNVWKRVKAKLEGRDLDPSRRVAVTEQVSHVIDEAISIDNLCQLYEGWTPWV